MMILPDCRLVAVGLLTMCFAGCLPMLAQGPHSVSELYLFRAANQERSARGLRPLQWDAALYGAAAAHARAMAARQSIAHRFAGEPELADRVGGTGMRFSVVAENVAEAPTAVSVQRGWMASPHHRDNLLDPRLDHVAISVLSSQGTLYAVEDFARAVPVLSLPEQEGLVAHLLFATARLRTETGTAGARSTCGMDSGFAGPRKPWFVVRFTAASLDRLPAPLLQRLASGTYREAEVGACPLGAAGGFSGYRIAVLLFHEYRDGSGQETR